MSSHTLTENITPVVTFREQMNIPFGTNSVDLVDEYYTRCMLLGHTEQFPNKFGTVTEVFLNQLRSHHTQERR